MSRLTSPPVLALCGDPDDAISWWRIQAPFARLRQHLIPALAQKLVLGAEYRIRPDGVIILPRLTPSLDPGARERVAAMIETLRTHSRAVVGEYDDDLFSEDYLRHHMLTRWPDGKTIEVKRAECESAVWALQQLDGVTVTTEPLAQLVRSLAPDVQVEVVPNALDIRWFRSKLAPRSLWAGRRTIGWAGGRRPAADFAVLADAWRRVARRHPDLLFVVVGDESAASLYRDLPADQIDVVAFGSVHDYPMAMQTDIGCCAVEREPFNERKTPIKSWEYGIAGAAVVATPTLYAQDVAHGFTGLLAETIDEWEDALERLIADEEQRRYLAASLAYRVEQFRGLDVCLPAWPDAWRSIVDQRERCGIEVSHAGVNVSAAYA